MFLNKAKKVDNDIKIHSRITQEKRREFEIDAILKPENNHSVFEYNRKTNTIRYADIIHPTVVNWHTWKQELNNREIIKNDHCVYVSALNVKNAIKHFNRAYNLNLTDKTINIQSDTTHAKRNLKFNITKEK